MWWAARKLSIMLSMTSLERSVLWFPSCWPHVFSGYDYFIRGMDEQNAELANGHSDPPLPWWVRL